MASPLFNQWKRKIFWEFLQKKKKPEKKKKKEMVPNLSEEKQSQLKKTCQRVFKEDQ